MKNTFLFIIVINGLILVGWITSFQTPHLHAYNTCIQYLKEGTLYGGQPYCDQGFFSYFFAYLFSFLPGTTENALLFSYFIGLGLTTHYLHKIIEAEATEDVFYFGLFFYLFIVLKHLDFPTLVATVFLFPGFYYLYFTERKTLGSVLLACSLFSKATILFVIGPIYLFYILNRVQQKKEAGHSWKLLFNEGVYSALTVGLPALFLFILLQIRFPKYIFYYLFLHQYRPESQPYSEIITPLVTGQYAYVGLILLLYIGLFLVIIRLFNKKYDVYSFMVSISLPTLYIKFANAHGLFIAATHFRYFIIFIPFYVVLAYKIQKELNQYSSWIKVLFFLGLFLLCIPLFQVVSGLTIQDVTDKSIFNDDAIINKLTMEVASPLYTISTTKEILMTNNFTGMHGNDNNFKYINKDKQKGFWTYTTTISSHEELDWTYAPFSVELGIVESLDPYLPQSTVDTDTLKKDYLAGKFGAILFWPYTNDMFFFFNNFSDSLDNTYYIVYFPFLLGPNIEETLNYIIVYVDDPYERTQLRNYMIHTYVDNFEYFCHRSHAAATVIKEIMEKNGITINKECHSYSKIINFNSALQIQEIYSALFIILFLFACAFNKNK